MSTERSPKAPGAERAPGASHGRSPARALARVTALPGEPTAAGEPTVADDLVRTTADEISDLQQRTRLLLACRVGQIVIDRFYAGDLTAWRSHGPKETSVRALVERLEELGTMSRQTLCRYLGVYELVERLGGVSALRQLDVAHCYAVLPLRQNPERQVELLMRAEAEGWKARQLERHVARQRNSAPKKPRKTTDVRFHARLEGLAREARELLGHARAGGGIETANAREKTFRLTMSARAALDELQRLSHFKDR